MFNSNLVEIVRNTGLSLVANASLNVNVQGNLENIEVRKAIVPGLAQFNRDVMIMVNNGEITKEQARDDIFMFVKDATIARVIEARKPISAEAARIAELEAQLAASEAKVAELVEIAKEAIKVARNNSNYAEVKVARKARPVLRNKVNAATPVVVPNLFM